VHQVLLGDDTIANAVNDNVATALFFFLEDYPFAFILNIIAIINCRLLCYFSDSDLW
jgi:choline/glycine/proline betaine transport protein